ncbi:MAG: ATP-binding protein [Polyangiales bacterium]
MDILAGAAFASCLVYVLLATYFGILAAARGLVATGEGLEYALFSAACVTMGGYALCNGMHFHAADPMDAAEWGRRGLYFAPPAVSLIVAIICIYGEISGRVRRAVLWLYGGGSLVVLALNKAGLVFAGTHVQSRVLGIGWVAYVNHGLPPTIALTVTQAFVLSGVGVITVVLVRSYLAGKREALLACLGAFVTGGCALNDVLVMNGVHRGIFLTEYGFAAFAFGLSYTLLARHARVSEELAAKGAELRRRSRQLRRSYEELRAAQEELVRKEQLAVVGEIAAVVSHEVRNPLAIIANAVAGLRRKETSEDDRATLLGILDEETDRLNRLVGDLLRYARPLTIERRLLDLDGLMSRALELQRNYDGVKLDVEARADPLPDVYGDPDLLRQVFDNLVQNACQAMTSGGTLSVRVAAAEDDGTSGVTVDVADTGEGMDTQVRSRARTPFFTTRPGGTGLGLAICDRIATAHGGFLSIKSRSGEGTVVSVFLPAGRRTETPVVKPSSQPPPPPRGMFGTPAFGTAIPGSRRGNR